MSQTSLGDKMYRYRSVVRLLILFVITKDCVQAQDLRNPASEFSRHSIVRPTVHHARTRREITTTRHTSGHHPDVTMTVAVDGEDYVLDLRLNEQLVTDGHILQYQENGKTVQHRPSKEELDICQYAGMVRNKPGSWVALSTCHGVRGVIFDGKRMKYIEPAEDNEITSNHFIYDHGDLKQHSHCGFNGGVTNNTQYDPLLLQKHVQQSDRDRSRISRYKRDTSETKVIGPYNANENSRYVELVLVADHREYQLSGDIQAVHRQMKDVANIINSVYTPLNIFIALVGVVVWTEQDEIQLVENGDMTLTNFLNYRKRTLLLEIPNDNAQLLTRQKFQDGVVGKALKGPICTYEFSGGVATNHSSVIGLVATTIAHEMGHNFGMEHDSDKDCECPDEKCIMSPSSTSVVPIHWSSCSKKSLALAFERGMDYCLRNKPKSLFESPTCGNGFVEEGEECDCGTAADKTVWNACQACCHVDTCMLRRNATCASGSCCDLETCRPKSAGTVCRASHKECDLPEYCTGYSEYCPADVHKMDTTPCGREDEAYCVRGSCRSRSDQCKLLWGTTGESSHHKCYYGNNVKGNQSGNCGYDRVRQIYRKCAPSDALCGMLHCRHLNERLEFGMENVAILSAIFINNNGKHDFELCAGTIIPCRTAVIDLGLNDVDPGLVPDGAKCGDDMMCHNQRCVPVEELRAGIAAREDSDCPSDCSGHGVCNSKGHCHCDVGFAPPRCELPGVGGSLDSGPATDPSVQRNFMIAMYIIFLGIIPSILLVMFLLYYSRHNVLPWWKRPKKSVQSPKKASLPRRLSRSATKFASNFQNGSQGNPPAVNVHTLSNPDDMSSSLLRSDSENSPPGNINPSANFFGNFKGFSLTPVEKQKEEAEKKAKTIADGIASKSAKITPLHRNSSNAQTILNQGVLKPVLRSAPPLPVVPVTAKVSPKSSPNVKRNNSTVQDRIKAFINVEKTEADKNAPAVNNPPQRLVISSPILEASTCTAKELISPLQGSRTLGPIRPAPTVPSDSPDLPKRPISMHLANNTNVLEKPLPDEPKKVKEGISLNRIASFLKQEKPKEKERNPVERSHSLPKNANNQVKVLKAGDKGTLRNLKISNPILQKDIELPVATVPVVSDSEDGEEPKSFVNRAQSMRAPAAQKPVLQSFGSMRQAPGVPRPVSVVGRPTAPPPPLPNETPVYQNPKPLVKPAEIKSTDYVDCIEEKQAPLAHIDEESGDNIYAVIEESPLKVSKPLPGVSQPLKTIPQEPPEGYNIPKPLASNSGSTESMGLLGEIVNEIQNRNFDSIYSTSTLARKKKEKADAEKRAENRDSTYMNADHYKTPESVYSNSGAKSNVSTTSSGYLHPSAVNVPTYLNNTENVKEDKTPPSPTVKTNVNNPNTKIPTFNRQVTPPGLNRQTTPPGLKTTTFKNVPQSPKNTPKNVNIGKIANSPDIVSSCGVDTKNVKPPDVINNNKVNDAPKVASKPSVSKVDNRPPLRPAPTIEKKPTLKPAPSIKTTTNSNTSLNKNVTNSNTSLNKSTDKDKNDKTTVNRANSKVDSNVKAIADNLNKNKPKVVPKPSTIVQRTDSNVKPSTKLTSKPSNVASLQQKFENRKSMGKEITTTKK